MFGTQCLAIECCLSGFTHYNLTSITRVRYCAPAAVCFVLEPEVSGAGGISWDQRGAGKRLLTVPQASCVCGPTPSTTARSRRRTVGETQGLTFLGGWASYFGFRKSCYGWLGRRTGRGGERNWGWNAGSVFLTRDTSMVLDLFGASWASLDSPFCLNTMQCYHCLVETVGSA